jgi:hypothetical protein
MSQLVLIVTILFSQGHAGANAFYAPDGENMEGCLNNIPNIVSAYKEVYPNLLSIYARCVSVPYTEPGEEVDINPNKKV